MYLIIAIRLIVGMLGTLFFLRIIGKAQMAEITPLDTVTSVVIGAIVGGVIYDPHTNSFELLFAIGVCTVFNLLIRYSLRFKVMRKLVKGDATYIIKSGILNVKELRRNGMEMEQLRTLLREVGVFSMFDVSDVRFETNGRVTVSKIDGTPESFLFVNNGAILESSLQQAGKDEEWLTNEMRKQNVTDWGEVFCVEWTPTRGFYVVLDDGKIIKGHTTTDADKADVGATN